MPSDRRFIKIHRMPEQSSGLSDQAFKEFKRYCSESHRPRLVLDCARISVMDTVALRQILGYLEEVMRYNGDIRLAALRPEAESVLRKTGVIRLFEIFATTESALQSYQSRGVSIAPLAYDDEFSGVRSEYAA